MKRVVANARPTRRTNENGSAYWPYSGFGVEMRGAWPPQPTGVQVDALFVAMVAEDGGEALQNRQISAADDCSGPSIEG